MVIFNRDQQRAFLDGVSVAPDSLLAIWTARIMEEPQHRDVPALTRAVLKDFSIRQLLGVAQSEVTLNWLAEAFDSLVDHVPVEQVFPLPRRPRHRPTDESLAIKVAWWVHLTIERDYSRVEAISMAADLFGRDVKSISRYVADQAHWVKGMSQEADWERYFRAERRPLPERGSLPERKDKKSRVPVPTKRRQT